MPDLSTFPITHRWPPERPALLQLYSAPTPNGVKISIMLEEVDAIYEGHFIDIARGEPKDPAFVSLNPNGRIPAILDPDGPAGRPIAIWESGAILAYLAEKFGRLMPRDPIHRYETLSWVFFQMSAVGPTFGQFGYFHKFAGREIEDPRPRDRYLDETRRLLAVMDSRLAGRDWLVGAGQGDYSIADIASLGWVNTLSTTYEASDLVGLTNFPNVVEWLAKGLARPAVQRGLQIPRRG